MGHYSAWMGDHLGTTGATGIGSDIDAASRSNPDLPRVGLCWCSSQVEHLQTSLGPKKMFFHIKLVKLFEALEIARGP